MTYTAEQWLKRAREIEDKQPGRCVTSVTCCGSAVTINGAVGCVVCGFTITQNELLRAHGLEEVVNARAVGANKSIKHWD